MKTLVTTAFQIPHFIEPYCRDIRDHGHNDVDIIIVGGRESHADLTSYCDYLTQTYGVPAQYFAFVDQAKLFKSTGYHDFLPWPSMYRKNAGIIKAYFKGAEVIYLLGNGCRLRSKDFIGQHLITSLPVQMTVANSASGWLNRYVLHRESHGRAFYPRGFPANLSQDKDRAFDWTASQKYVWPMISIGSTVGKPDTDASTELLGPYDVEIAHRGVIAVDSGVKMPFSCENLAFHRYLGPAMCLPVDVGGYNDTFMSYFAKRVADQIGKCVVFGEPCVTSNRITDVWRELEAEKTRISMVDIVTDAIYDTPLKSNTVSGCTRELLAKFKGIVLSKNSLTEEQTTYADIISENYTRWLEAFDSLTGRV